MEELKKVKLKGLSDFVEINVDGTVIKFQNKVVSQHKVKTSKNSFGYRAVSIQAKSFYVHRIVAQAYIHNNKPITHKYVLRIDNDLSNNHYTNLMWGTGKDLQKKNTKKGTKDEPKYRGSSSISYDEALKIAKRLDEGEFAKDICIEYGVSEMSIARIRKRYCKSKNVSPRYNDEIKAMVFKLLKKYDAAEVAKMTGLSYHTIYRWKKKGDEFEGKPTFHY